MTIIAGIKIAHSIENALKISLNVFVVVLWSEHEICEFCLDESRDKIKKLLYCSKCKRYFVIEDSKQFDGKYFVIVN